MKVPPLVLFTNVTAPGTPDGPLGVRADIVVLVERASLRLEEKVAPGVRTIKAPERQVEATCLHLVGGGKAFVHESPEVVTKAINAALRPARWGLFS